MTLRVKKIKVLHILNTARFSGAENVVITMIRNYSNEVDAVYMSLDGIIRENLNEFGIKYYPVKKLSVSNIKKAIREIQPDIIHAHDFTASVLVSFIWTKKPVISHLHNNVPWLRKYCFNSFLFLTTCLKAKKILTVSESVMNEYVFGKKFLKKTTITGNPVDTKSIRKKSNEYEWKKNYDIAFLGRLCEQKNPVLFLEIVEAVKKNKPDIKAVMIGDGEMKDEVENKISELNLNNNIELAGFQKNPFPILKKSKLLCMPSSWEGFGLAAVEALSLGLPVISSNAGGLPKIINKSCGKICHEKNEYSDTIIKILNDSELFERMKKGAYARADELDNVSEYSKNILEIYRDLLKK